MRSIGDCGRILAVLATGLAVAACGATVYQASAAGPARRHANDLTRSSRRASHTAGRDIDASAVASTGHDATSYGQPAAA